ncbi:MAG: molybdenum cofactor guanylyltransferase [Burkholderiales bacterium]|nr:MAG: molybdenum cofactor guanylyltransferase [Burkholderiales bacterium]
MTDRLGAVILAGGQSSRMGEDKAVMTWNGRRAIDLVVDLASDAGCESVTVAGRDYGYPHVRDPAPDCGPAVALLAAIRSVPALDRVLVLAIDAPLLDLADLRPLLDLRGAGASFCNLPVPMHIRREAAANARGSTSLRQIVARAGLIQVTPRAGSEMMLRGANTPAEASALRSLGNPSPDNS